LSSTEKQAKPAQFANRFLAKELAPQGRLISDGGHSL
jgi:hypothetical protein